MRAKNLYWMSTQINYPFICCSFISVLESPVWLQLAANSPAMALNFWTITLSNYMSSNDCVLKIKTCLGMSPTVKCKICFCGFVFQDNGYTDSKLPLPMLWQCTSNLQHSASRVLAAALKSLCLITYNLNVMKMFLRKEKAIKPI